jgi:Vacuolar protein sorting-associated protein 62
VLERSTSGADSDPQRRMSSGQPYLLLGSTNNYTWMYTDSGTRSYRNLSVWRPKPTAAGYFILGDYAQGDYGAPYGRSLIVQSVNDPNETLLQPPGDYRQVWNDRGSGGHYEGSFWYPVPPDNYVSLGFVVQAGYHKPLVPSYRCLHQGLLARASVGPSIWSDAGSAAYEDITLFQVAGVEGIFVADSVPFLRPVYSIKTRGTSLFDKDHRNDRRDAVGRALWHRFPSEATPHDQVRPRSRDEPSD